MAFVAGPAFVVDKSAPPEWDPRPDLTDLRVTPGGGFQVVWDSSRVTGFHETSYRIFDAAGQPLTGEVFDGSYQGGDPAVHLQQSIQLDDGTFLKVEREFNTSAPGGWLVLQLYHESGVPLGGPILTTGTFTAWWRAGLAQLPNRDIVFVADAGTKLGENYLFSWVLDNTSPDLYPPVLTRIAGADGAAEVAPDGTIVVNFNELIALAPSVRIDLKTASGQLVDSFDVSDGADLSAWVSSLTIRPAVTLDPGTEYVLDFHAGSVLDPSGNAFAGGGFHFTTAGAPPEGETAPSVIDFYPGAAPLPVDWSPGITFDEEVKAGSGTIRLETAAGQVVQTFGADDAGLQIFGASVLIDPAADLLPGTTYQLFVEAGAFEDLAGNDAGASDFTFTTAGDPTPPLAIDFFPAPGSTALPTDWSLGITFNEEVQAGSGTITLQTAAGQVVQVFSPGAPTGVQFFGSRVLIDPVPELLPGTTYRLIVEPGAFEDLSGNPYAGTSDYTFTTAGEAPPQGDTTRPSAIVFFPDLLHPQPLPTDWSPAITYTEDVKAGTGTITLQTAAGEVVQTFSATDAGIHYFGATVLIDPAADLLPGTTYQLSVQAGAFVDLAGNDAYPTSFSFTTEAALVGVPSSV